ncbi:MAG: hypothetical protein AB7P07_01405 [Hyphomonadaceae bacterium]
MPQSARTVMLMGGAVLAAVAGSSLISSSAVARAQETHDAQNTAAQAVVMAEGVEVTSGAVYFDDPLQLSQTNKDAIDLTVREDQNARFTNLSAYAPAGEGEASDQRAVELELGADRFASGLPVDVSIAHRTSFGSDAEGDINRRGTGAEVRIGRSLGDPSTGMSGGNSRVYVFAASDDEAVTWTPGAVTRGYAYQEDRVEIGDIQAGVTYERGPMQASLAYVEREISHHYGQNSVSQDEAFAGVTLTMRR